jgi:site-specific DNA-cytosine methylase
MSSLGFSEFNNNTYEPTHERSKKGSVNMKKTRKNRNVKRNKKVEQFLESITNDDNGEDETMGDVEYTDSQHSLHHMSPHTQTQTHTTDDISRYGSELLPPPQLQHPSPSFRKSGGGSNSNNNHHASNQANSETDDSVTPEGFNTLQSNEERMQEYYRSYIPYYTQAGNQQEVSGSKDMLIEKLNYMIQLLEDQQEEKTGHVTEELVLYSFLGVFVIFVVDSFARAGRYTR